MELSNAEHLTGSLWGYAEGDPTVIGILVAAVVVAALGFVVLRLVRARNRTGAAPGNEKRRG